MAPSAAVHRADLQALLVREAGEVTLRLDAELVGFKQEDEISVRVVLVGGSEAHADILVEADGLRSKIRTRLFGSEKPHYAAGGGGAESLGREPHRRFLLRFWYRGTSDESGV